jgi:hypothetical protein
MGAEKAPSASVYWAPGDSLRRAPVAPFQEEWLDNHRRGWQRLFFLSVEKGANVISLFGVFVRSGSSQ